MKLTEVKAGKRKSAVARRDGWQQGRRARLGLVRERGRRSLLAGILESLLQLSPLRPESLSPEAGVASIHCSMTAKRKKVLVIWIWSDSVDGRHRHDCLQSRSSVRSTSARLETPRDVAYSHSCRSVSRYLTSVPSRSLRARASAKYASQASVNVVTRALPLPHKSRPGLLLRGESRRFKVVPELIHSALGIIPDSALPRQPDGGEVLAKRKGVVARRGLEAAWSKGASRSTRTGCEALGWARNGSELRCGTTAPRP